MGNWQAISIDRNAGGQVNLSNKIMTTAFSNPIVTKKGTFNDKDPPCMIEIVESHRNHKQKEPGVL